MLFVILTSCITYGAGHCSDADVVTEVDVRVGVRIGVRRGCLCRLCLVLVCRLVRL